MLSQLSNFLNKIQYSKVDKESRTREYETSLDWLEASNMLLSSKCVKILEIPLTLLVDIDAFKLYLSDVGILDNILKISISDILNDNISLYKGIITENYVANQCSNNAEIDFLLYTSDGLILLEVKASDATKSKSLDVYKTKFNQKYSIRVSSKDFNYNPEKKIKSIPLYAVFCIKE